MIFGVHIMHDYRLYAMLLSLQTSSVIAPLPKKSSC